jgi:hypothetical protein
MCLAKLSNFGVQRTAGSPAHQVGGRTLAPSLSWPHTSARSQTTAVFATRLLGEVEDTMTAGEGSRGVLPTLRVVAWMVVVASSTGTHSAHTDRPAIVVRVRVHGNTCE